MGLLSLGRPGAENEPDAPAADATDAAADGTLGAMQPLRPVVSALAVQQTPTPSLPGASSDVAPKVNAAVTVANAVAAAAAAATIAPTPAQHSPTHPMAAGAAPDGSAAGFAHGVGGGMGPCANACGGMSCGGPPPALLVSVPPIPPRPLIGGPVLGGDGASVSLSAIDDDEDDNQPHAAKKFKHNVAERRRTSRLNSLFDELSALLSSRPDIFCDSGLRHSKADVSDCAAPHPFLHAHLPACKWCEGSAARVVTCGTHPV